VWHDALDAFLHPARYAVTGASTTGASTYLANAQQALPPGFVSMTVRFPLGDGPVTVLARGEEGPTRQLLTVYLDPPAGRVLDVVNIRSSLIGFLHRFHENLTIADYSGRAVVGWVGVGMLVLSLTGLWLWWPRQGTLLAGLRWRRSGEAKTPNLHYCLGFWLALPLALVSLTGIYLSFPQAARTTMSAVAPMNPPAGRPIFAARLARDTRLTADAAIDAARQAKPGWSPSALFLATVQAEGGPRQGKRAGTSGRASALWRVQMQQPSSDDVATVLVSDDDASVRILPDPLAGDRAARWIRHIHDGTRGTVHWQMVVFLTGLIPPVLAVTGFVMWVRRRQRRASVRGQSTHKVVQPGVAQPAE